MAREIKISREQFAARQRELDAANLTNTAREWIQTIPTNILTAAARGELDLNELAIDELRHNRGVMPQKG